MNPRTDLIAVAAAMVRLEGVCERRHPEGPKDAHVHASRVLRWGQQLSMIQEAMLPARHPAGDWSLDETRARAKAGVSWEPGSVPSHVSSALGAAMIDRRHLLAEVDELQALFDLQWTRMGEATELWRAAHPGKELVMPDLGDLLTWLMAQIPSKSAGDAEGLRAIRATRQMDERLRYTNPPYPGIVTNDPDAGL